MVGSFFAALLILSLLLYLPLPSHGFGMPANWNYQKELQVYELIQSQNLNNYNIANLVYDPVAPVQKYLHAKNNKNYDSANYATNTYLFVIGSEEEVNTTWAYEVNTFTPRPLLQRWPIDKQRSLFLFERN